MNLRRKTEKEKEWTSSGRSRRYIWIERSMFSIVYCKTGWQRNRNINTVTMIQSWPQAQCYIPPFTIPRPKVKRHKTHTNKTKRPGLWGNRCLQSCHRKSRIQCEFSPSISIKLSSAFGLNQKVEIQKKKFFTRIHSAEQKEERIRNILSSSSVFIFAKESSENVQICF